MSSEQAKAYHSITIGDKNTWDDWHLVPTSRPLVPPPSVNASYVTIPGSNGALDLTEALTGYPTYTNRTGSWEFLVLNGYGEWYARYSEIMAYLHGKKFRAILDDDPNYYYEGRFAVDSWASNKDWSRITINYNVGPYKIEVHGIDENWLWDTFNFETDMVHACKDIEVSGTKEVTIYNDIMRVRPTIVCSAAMSVSFLGKSYQLSSGTNSIREIVFSEGANTLTFTGNGTVTIQMHGGRF